MDLYSSHGVEAEGIPEIEDGQQDLNQTFQEQVEDDTVFSEPEGIRERAAGLLIVPRIGMDMIESITLMNNILGSLEDTYPDLVPEWFTTMIRSLFYASLFFGLIALALRFRS